MTRLLMCALALLAFCSTAGAQETQACGVPIANGDGWALARPASSLATLRATKGVYGLHGKRNVMRRLGLSSSLLE